MKSVSPNIFVNDLKANISFYSKLGFKVLNSVPDEENPVWVMMGSGEVVFMFQSFESLGTEMPQISRSRGGSLLLYIQTTGIRDLFERIKNEVKVLKGLETTFYEATEFSIEDPNGYVLTFAEDE